MSALPPGWVMQQDQHGRTFYVDTTTGQSSWTPPPAAGPPPSVAPTPVNASYGATPASQAPQYGAGTSATQPPQYGYGGAGGAAPPQQAPPPAASATPLPPGWIEQVDPASGRPFYVDTATGQSHWTLPAATAAAAPPPPAYMPSAGGYTPGSYGGVDVFAPAQHTRWFSLPMGVVTGTVEVKDDAGVVVGRFTEHNGILTLTSAQGAPQLTMKKLPQASSLETSRAMYDIEMGGKPAGTLMRKVNPVGADHYYTHPPDFNTLPIFAQGRLFQYNYQFMVRMSPEEIQKKEASQAKKSGFGKFMSQVKEAAGGNDWEKYKTVGCASHAHMQQQDKTRYGVEVGPGQSAAFLLAMAVGVDATKAETGNLGV